MTAGHFLSVHISRVTVLIRYTCTCTLYMSCTCHVHVYSFENRPDHLPPFFHLHVELSVHAIANGGALYMYSGTSPIRTPFGPNV